jgi:hypothetical protein
VIGTIHGKARRFLARRVPNCVWWMDASRGITQTSSATLTSTLTSWTASQATVTNNGDGTYRISVTSTTPQVTGTPTSVRSETADQPPIIYKFKFKSTASVTWVLVETASTGAAASRVWFDISTAALGTVGAAQSDVSISAPDVNGLMSCSITVNAQATAPRLRFRPVTANGGTTAPSNGSTFDVQFNSIEQYLITGAKNRVSNNTWNTTGGTLTLDNRPWLRRLTRLAIKFDGNQLLYSTTDTNVTSTMQANDGPFTAFIGHRAFDGTNQAILSGTNSGDAGYAWTCFHNTISAAVRAAMFIRDTAGVTAQVDGPTHAVGTTRILEWVGPGTTVSIRVNGGTASSGAWNVGTRSFNRAVLGSLYRIDTVGTPSTAAVFAGSLYSRALSTGEASYLRRSLGRKLSVAVTA